MNPDYVPNPDITFQPDSALFWLICSGLGYLVGALGFRSGVASIIGGWAPLLVGLFVVDEISPMLLLVLALQGVGAVMMYIVFRK